MKVCIIGFPRSRSSLLLDTIAKYHRTIILGESLNLATNARITIDSEAYTDLLESIEVTPSGVIRLHPLQLMRIPYKNSSSNFDLFNFKQYEKIYFTSRDSVADSIASELIAKTLKKYTYQDVNSIVKDIQPVELKSYQHYIVEEYVYSERLVEQLKTYLKQNNIEYTALTYDNIPSYIEQAYPGIVSSHVETHYDYRALVTNYDSIEEVYTRIKNVE